MIDALISFLQTILWGPPMLILFLFTGLYFTIRTKGFQLFHIPTWFSKTLLETFRSNQKSHDKSSVTPFQALCTSLAATVGTGNIVGVATAIVIGGPGAIFWMWISAILGMMTSFAEKYLGVRYRYQSLDGTWIGGPMVYLERGVHSPFLAHLFSIFCIIVSFGMGNMVQGNTISEALSYSFHIPTNITGICLLVLMAIIIMGGIKRIVRITEYLVPFMSLFYIALGLFVIGAHIDQVLPSLHLICKSAFTPCSIGGGAVGYGVLSSMRMGISRGVFSNEAGLGSSVMIHSASSNNDPTIQGMWGICEVFIDTILLCTITALVILTSGFYDVSSYLFSMNQKKEVLSGASLTSASFSTVLPYGEILLSCSILLFAFATIIGWSYFGEKATVYLLGKKWIPVYRVLYVMATYWGCTMSLNLVWAISDIFNALMALPNLYALWILRKEVILKHTHGVQTKKMP